MFRSVGSQQAVLAVGGGEGGGEERGAREESLRAASLELLYGQAGEGTVRGNIVKLEQLEHTKRQQNLTLKL